MISSPFRSPTAIDPKRWQASALQRKKSQESHSKKPLPEPRDNRTEYPTSPRILAKLNLPLPIKFLLKRPPRSTVSVRRSRSSHQGPARGPCQNASVFERARMKVAFLGSWTIVGNCPFPAYCRFGADLRYWLGAWEGSAVL